MNNTIIPCPSPLGGREQSPSPKGRGAGVRVGAIILAAGMSRRMGRPKMLLPWGETSVLGQVVKTFSEAGVSEIVAVTGGAREIVEAEVARLAGNFPVRAVFNRLYESGGMLESVQAGLAALGPDVDATFIGLGDQPQGGVCTAREILSAYNQTRRGIIIPSFEMRRGHPYLLDRAFWAELLAMQPPQTLRDFLNAHGGEILYVPADESILLDLDTPEDYERYLKNAQ